MLFFGLFQKPFHKTPFQNVYSLLKDLVNTPKIEVLVQKIINLFIYDA